MFKGNGVVLGLEHWWGRDANAFHRNLSEVFFFFFFFFLRYFLFENILKY